MSDRAPRVSIVVPVFNSPDLHELRARIQAVFATRAEEYELILVDDCSSDPETWPTLEYLAKGLVSHPNAVEIHETTGAGATVLQLKVAKEDLGRIIGKQGRTAKSIRTLVNAAAAIENRTVVLEIFEEK